MHSKNSSIFQRPVWAAVFAFTAAFLWGWAYPFIKLGFAEFEITSEMTGSKMLFAGIRFFISGLIILSVARMAHRSFDLKEAAKSNIWGSGLFLLAFTLLNTTLHYACFYNKLLTCNPVGKIAIWNSLIPVVGAATSCLCLHEVFVWNYAVAATLTTAGIYVINKGKGME